MTWAENSLPCEIPPSVGFLFFPLLGMKTLMAKVAGSTGDPPGIRGWLFECFLHVYFWNARVHLCNAIQHGMKETWAGSRKLEYLWGSDLTPGAASFDPWRSRTGLVRCLCAHKVSGSRSGYRELYLAICIACSAFHKSIPIVYVLKFFLCGQEGCLVSYRPVLEELELLRKIF